MADIAKADAPAGLLAAVDFLIKVVHLLRGHAHAVVCNGDHDVLSLLPDPQRDPAPVLLVFQAVVKGVLHHGLEGEGGEADPGGVHPENCAAGDAAVEAHLLEVQVM